MNREAGDHRPPLSDQPLFRDWAAWTKLQNDIGDANLKKSIEYIKISADFSKIIITNLQFINAGGLAAVPTLSGTVLGWNGLAYHDKIFLIGIPMMLFAVGLLLAALCALATYRNYQALGEIEFSEREYLLIQATGLNPYIANHLSSIKDDRMREIGTSNKKLRRKMIFNYYAGLINGSISAVMFISACSFIAWNAR